MTPARRLRVVLVAVTAAAALTPAPAVAAPFEVGVAGARGAARIGDDFPFAIVVRNTGARTATGLIAHLNVFSTVPGTEVDPEDWSSDRTRYLAPLPSGATVRVAWTVKAVDDGRVALYAGVVARDGEVAVTPAVDVRVASRQSIEAGGALPVAVGVPLLLALLWLTVRRRRRVSARA
jgi:hypothetical protein